MPSSTRNRGKVLRIALLTCAMVLVVVGAAAAHDMFLKPARFFAAENAEVLVRVLNARSARARTRSLGPA